MPDCSALRWEDGPSVIRLVIEPVSTSMNMLPVELSFTLILLDFFSKLVMETVPLAYFKLKPHHMLRHWLADSRSKLLLSSTFHQPHPA
jgi:hypothetical protein